jgi:hypothetical protein
MLNQLPLRYHRPTNRGSKPMDYQQQCSQPQKPVTGSVNFVTLDAHVKMRQQKA